MNSALPPITTGTEKYIFDCGEYSGLIMENLNDMGTMEYPFALLIYEKGDVKQFMIIVAEFNAMDALLLKEVQGDDSLLDSTKKYFLCSYEGNERMTYGYIEKLDDFEVFKTKAFEVLRSRLGITDDIVLREVNNNVKEIQKLFEKINVLDSVKDINEILDILNEIQKLDTGNEFTEATRKTKKAFLKLSTTIGEGSTEIDESVYKESYSKNNVGYSKWDKHVKIIFGIVGIIIVFAIISKLTG